MGVYKIFPSQDTTIYTDYNTLNAGLDPLLDLSKKPSTLYPSSSVSRILLKFDNDDLNIAIIKAGNNFTASLKLYGANLEGIPTDFSIVANPVYENWDMGTGQFNNIPESQDGASWKFRSANQTNEWTTAGLPVGVTTDYYSVNPGGGNWYTNYEASQSFSHFSTKDISLNLTSMVNAWMSNTISNNGIIIRNTGSIEFDPNYNYTFNFYSRDTHTIYVPYLEFTWVDYVYNPGTTPFILNENILVSIANNKNKFYDGEKTKFRIYAKEKYPQRTYTRQSLYASNKLLPISSYYSIIDLDTNLTVIDFGPATRLSADSTSSYFILDMNGFEPDRYYKIQIKSIIGTDTYIYDNDYYFKVVQTIK